MATATSSSGEGGDEEKALEDELIELRQAKEEIVERASEELATVAQREDECRNKLHRLRTQKKQQQEGESSTVVKSDVQAPELSEIVVSGNATECEIDRVQSENVELKQALDEAAKQSKAQSEKTAELEKDLNETRQSLSAVREQLTVAEQVTAATQQRALQESDNSEQLQLELAPHQPAECAGLAVSFKSVNL